jgi:hypothetical protein
MQDGVCRRRICRNAIFRTRGEFLDDGGGERLLDLVSLSLIDECRNGNGAQVGWQQVGAASGVITASDGKN